jgi:DALR anticodon binding domain
VSSPPPPILHSALHRLLVNWLQKSKPCSDLGLFSPASSSSGNLTEDSPSLVFLHSRDIPLNRIKFNPQSLGDSHAQHQVIHYVSAVAIKLGQLYHHPPETLAQAIAASFQQFQAASSAEPLDQILQKFTVSVAPSGWLHFQLSEAGIAQWLQQLTNATRVPSLLLQSEATGLNHHTSSFHLWVAHARCCTLLRRAEADARLNLHTPNWLSAGHLRFTQPAEWALMLQISDTLDSLTESPVRLKQSLKVAIGLSEVFQSFDANCRIWGDRRQPDQPLTEVRLGLVQITQFLLRLLLEDNLGLPAPSEL